MSQMKLLNFSAWQLWISFVSTAKFFCYINADVVDFKLPSIKPE